MLDQILDAVATAVAGQCKALDVVATARMHSLLADGADQLAAGRRSREGGSSSRLCPLAGS
uniref:Uncharacterized protein n=1 Tax=Phenylobacterium glaciei TaxID=2803784 RepID=A0A974S938_9CAUL|nr:hypothetical protein JKL49_13225 [Phenylobacterium glaciei]